MKPKVGQKLVMKFNTGGYAKGSTVKVIRVDQNGDESYPRIKVRGVSENWIYDDDVKPLRRTKCKR